MLWLEHDDSMRYFIPGRVDTSQLCCGVVHLLSPNDLVVEALSLGARDQRRGRAEARNDFSNLSGLLFPGQTAIEKYFREIILRVYGLTG